MEIKRKENIVICNAEAYDFQEILAIYAYYVTHTTISFEENPPALENMLKRWKDSTDRLLPYLVAKHEGRVVGYAYAFQYRPRTAYRYTLEESVYVSKDHRGFGIGHSLLSDVIRQCQEKNYKQMLAVITGTDNVASLAFHRNLGFKQSGVLEKVGFKFDKWIDTVLMQKEL
jgi:phosphinothricin acetyltransferase